MKDYLKEPFKKEPPPMEATALTVLKHWDSMSNYIEVTTTSELERLIRVNAEQTEMGLDTETTGVDVITAKCLGYSFSFEPHTAYWVPVQIDPQLRLLNDLVQNKKIIFFNAGYDLAIVEKYNVEIEQKNICDMMIACYFRDVNNYQRNAGLKAQAQMLLDLQTVGLKEILAANKGVDKIKDDEVNFLDLTPPQRRIYACQDADITMMLYRHPEIIVAMNRTPEIWKLEHDLIRPVMEMYRNGIGIDLKRNAELDEILKVEIEKCNTAANAIAVNAIENLLASGAELPTITVTTTKKGVKETKEVDPIDELKRLSKKTGLNLGSFKQKQLILFNVLQLPLTTATSTGHSTDQHALAEIMNEHEIVPMIMRYNRLKNRRSAYTNKFPKLVNEVTGRIHASLWPQGAVTGRFTCSNPNMQGVSKDREDNDPVHIREIIVPAVGNELTAVDYSQIELRIAGSLSREPLLCDAYHADIDVHTKTATGIYGIGMNDVTEVQRIKAKTANFSVLLGISAQKLSSRNRDSLPTTADAQNLIDRWFESMPVLTKWIESIKKRARVTGQMETYFGRIRPFPEIKYPRPDLISDRAQEFSSRPWGNNYTWEELLNMARKSLISGAERQAVSQIIQGTAADIMKIAIVKMYRELKKSKLPVKMLLTVHDELLFEHPPEVQEEFHALAKRVMTFEKLGDGWVPLTVDIGYGANWSEAH